MSRRNDVDPDLADQTEELVNPFGTKIMVSKKRAEALLGRQSIDLGANKRAYQRAADVDEPQPRVLKPRRGRPPMHPVMSDNVDESGVDDLDKE